MTFDATTENFESLSACVKFLQSKRTDVCENPGVRCNDVGYLGGQPAPRYLFRGECTNKYPTTSSMLVRVMADRTLLPKCRSQILALGERVIDDLKKFIGMDTDLAIGFCQHYEYPTRFLDFTSDSKIAAYFASKGAVGDAGLMCVLDVMKASAVAKIVDLTQHPKAERPRRQKAYVLASPGFYDLKARETIDVAGIEWFGFTLTQNDKTIFGENAPLLEAGSNSARTNAHLLNAASDQVAGILQLSIDSFGKINDWSAKWLSDHIVPAPFITRLDQRTHELILTSATDSGLQFDETTERFNNYRCWSINYSDTRGKGGFENLWPTRKQ